MLSSRTLPVIVEYDLQSFSIQKPTSEGRGRAIREVTSLSVKHRDQSNIRVHVTSHTQWGYGNFSPHTLNFEHNSYDCYEENRLGARKGYIDKSWNYVKIDERFHKRREDKRYHDIRACVMNIMIIIACRETLSYNNFKLALLWGTFSLYDYKASEQEVESLSYSYSVREEEKFQLVLKSLS
ncbi:hypothetical protein M9H77_16693 [Catharanthus roseus]|uniref:Uncharacterized protein n=1 Tax=Catharanthus roseus TaxID=4058 RepID=A0ACC0B2H2_CATRO|nr:hypothetical protein M9H77_16693 [Catharanthus roseus]